jgi:hypothetical protein
MSNTRTAQAENGSTRTRTADDTRRISTETKASFKTSELIAYVVVVLGVLIASQTVGDDTGAGDGDYFRADKAWLYITVLTVGYLLSRGLAKSGSRDFYDDDSRR